MPTALAIARPVQWVVSPGGSVSGQRDDPVDRPPGRAAGCAAAGSCRAAARRRPSCMKRSCQRQTQVFDLPVRRMISAVPRPSAVTSTIRPARHASAGCCGPDDRLQTAAIGGGDGDGDTGAHAPDSHASNPAGIPRDSTVRFHPLAPQATPAARSSAMREALSE